MERFRRLEVLGQGTYGTVYKALDLQTNRLVALKKTTLSNDDEGIPATTLREVSILRALSDCENIVKLIDVIHAESRGRRPLLYLVFEYAEGDLKQYMNRHRGRGKGLPLKQAKCFAYQLLLGLHFCHLRGVMHRDLKPQNILVTNQDRTVKLADFGLGRAFCIPVGKYTHEVVTLWYRAPEILLGTRCYSTPVDVWSVGCILAEMIRVVELRDWHDFPQWKARPLIQILPDLGETGCALLSEMLRLDPSRRITAAEALRHPFFDDVRPQYASATLAVAPPRAVPALNAGELAARNYNRILRDHQDTMQLPEDVMVSDTSTGTDENLPPGPENEAMIP
ncbi:hypothetical protein F1559_001826 [Cyanidiococcus yangmingshanensis]|uniref:cyclin-dependent kinase n=1 Tax=Cyanidiococcus yangmingshanensis TaxID=2690220 RepID=A0A7J7IFN7_9RHOD|nr:hypothetical protein F1559_001826 [Cyanidiococcus yangmingshanensis]